MSALKVFKVDHDGIVLGGISVVFAESEDDARRLMSDWLAEEKFGLEIFRLEEISNDRGVVMLWNGDY